MATIKEIRDNLKKRGEGLQEHYEKFKELKEKGDLEGALKQLAVTLEYANETLSYSLEISKKFGKNIELEEKKKGKKEPKFLVFPKNQNVH